MGAENGVQRLRALRDRSLQLGSYLRGSKAAVPFYKEAFTYTITATTDDKNGSVHQVFEDKPLIIDCSLSRTLLGAGDNRDIFLCISIYSIQTKALIGISVLQLQLDKAEVDSSSAMFSSENGVTDRRSASLRLQSPFMTLSTQIPFTESVFLPVINSDNLCQQLHLSSDASPFEIQKSFIENITKGRLDLNFPNNREEFVCIDIGFMKKSNSVLYSIINLFQKLASLCESTNILNHDTCKGKIGAISSFIYKYIVELGNVKNDKIMLIETTFGARNIILRENMLSSKSLKDMSQLLLYYTYQIIKNTCVARKFGTKKQ